MKRSRFKEEQIIGILKEHQAGVAARDLCRKYGIFATARSPVFKENWISFLPIAEIRS